ncbi:MAG: hypothetical protein J5525_13500 [Lachnospiraceae bacterium]|nr:hypothetical protein [Lachnospiraceae bacterium]
MRKRVPLYILWFITMFGLEFWFIYESVDRIYTNSLLETQVIINNASEVAMEGIKRYMFESKLFIVAAVAGIIALITSIFIIYDKEANRQNTVKQKKITSQKAINIVVNILEIVGMACPNISAAVMEYNVKTKNLAIKIKPYGINKYIYAKNYKPAVKSWPQREPSIKNLLIRLTRECKAMDKQTLSSIRISLDPTGQINAYAKYI